MKDIYKWAEEMDYLCDYFDIYNDLIYCCIEYGKNKKYNPNAKIRVVDSNKSTIGYAIKLKDRIEIRYENNRENNISTVS